eukprot:TRINITY_DN115553_c0_g1_i1.p2 TRINITY_DN115553_c0_g1~~TRINITY_DN115553_c0_g1_i1.p2  ORF type:complete len:107 (+),score=5.20 TRINITY_DN115553_c0_g1_i1:210-530(+)
MGIRRVRRNAQARHAGQSGGCACCVCGPAWRHHMERCEWRDGSSVAICQNILGGIHVVFGVLVGLAPVVPPQFLPQALEDVLLTNDAWRELQRNEQGQLQVVLAKY